MQCSIRFFTALSFLLGPGAATLVGAQALPPATPPMIAVEAPAIPGDTVHLDGVCVLGQAFRGRETTKCCGCGCSNPAIIITEEIQPTGFLTIQPILPRLAGVQVTPNSGAPGDWATVRIRGGSSLTSPDQPLYVVDGVPALNADFAPGVRIQAAFSLGSGPEAARTGANPLLALPLEDIATVTVISGGAAAAYYGAQGSNGVIEITTKRGGKQGQEQPLRVRYNAFGGVQQVRQRYDLLNARQYADLANEASSGNAPYPLSGPVAPDTDWQAELFRPAVLHNHHLSFDGSSARTRYAVSADYLSQAGVVMHSGLERYALRLNFDQQLGRRLRLFLNTSATAINQNLPVTGTVAQALLAPPTVSVRDAQGNFQRYGFANASRNPLDLATTDGTATTTHRLLLHIGAEYTLSPGFTLLANLSREEVGVVGSTHFLVNAGQQYAAPTTATSTLSLPATTTVAQAHLSYGHTYADAHRLNLRANAGLQHYRRGTTSTYRDDATASDYRTNATTTLSNVSLLATYTYRERYEAVATLRRDANQGATLVFNREVPTVWLPGAEVRWHLHQENFLANSPVFNTVTLWASLGQTSATSLPGTGWGSGVASDHIRPGATTLITSAPVPPAPRTTQLEAGLTANLWQNRLQVNFTAFRRNTAHLTVSQLLLMPAPTGAEALTLPREAALRNQGLLLAINSWWKGGAFSGVTNLSASWQQQRVTAVTELPGAGNMPGLVVGEAPHPFFLYQRLPVPAVGAVDARGQSIAGQLRYQDVNNDGYITDADARYQGTALPTQLYTLSQTLSLERFTLKAQLDALAGHQLLNTTLATLDLPTGNTNGTTRLLDRWTPTHYNPDIPQAGTAAIPAGLNTPRYDDSQLQSAASLRLSQLTFSYALRPAASPHPLSLWVEVQNLFVISNYRGFDPTVSSGGATLLAAGYDTNYYPTPRTWLLGVRATL